MAANRDYDSSFFAPIFTDTWREHRGQSHVSLQAVGPCSAQIGVQLWTLVSPAGQC